MVKRQESDTGPFPAFPRGGLAEIKETLNSQSCQLALPSQFKYRYLCRVILNYMMSEKKLITRDYLALERTFLANERTFLAYFRTSMGFLASGLSVIQFESLKEIHEIGWGLLAVSPLLFTIGLLRYYHVKRTIRKYYHEATED